MSPDVSIDSASSPVTIDTHPETANGSGERFGESNRPRAFLYAIGLAVSSIIFLGIWSVPISGAYYFLTGSIPSDAFALLFETIGLGLGTLTFAVVFIKFSEADRSYIDVSRPRFIWVALGVLGTGILLVFSAAIIQLFAAYGITGSEHAIYEIATSESSAVSPEFFLLFVPLSILVIGPAEEFIYRNVVQKSLYPAFGTVGAILLTSIIFALVHFPAYLTGTPAEATITLCSVLVLSVVLGTLYAVSGSLIVPALAHGLYNATLFVFLYAELVGGL